MYAQIKDLQLALEKPKKFVRDNDIFRFRLVVQEALRRANNDPEVSISEITAGEAGDGVIAILTLLSPPSG